MLTPNELETIPKALEMQFRQLENRVMSDIVRRLKSAGEMTASAEYQAGRLLSMGVSQKDIEKLIGNTLELSEKEVAKIYDDIIAKSYADDLKLIKSAGKNVLPYRDNKSLQQLISAVKTQTNDTFKNITQSLGFAVKQNGKMTFKPIADYYQKILDGAVLDITTGAFDYNTVLKRAVAEMTNSGLRTVNYATGHSDRVDVAVRRAVMTGVNQVTARITEQNMDILGTEYVEVSWHSGARPSHQEWQGKIYHWNRGKSSTNSQNTVDNSGESGIINTRDNFAESLTDFNPLSSETVINTLRVESDKWLNTLTSEEVRAIKKYTKNSNEPKDNKFYQRLNAMLRGDVKKDSTLIYYAELISQALKKNSLNNDIICYRSMNTNPFTSFCVGDIFIPKQFFSTSVSKKGALNGDYKMKIYAKKGTKGAYIEKLSKFPKQREFLIDKDCAYRILSIGNNEIELEVIV